MDDIIKVADFARACAEEAAALRDKYNKDRENFLASVGQVWDVSGPNPLIDPARRCDGYATSVATFAKNGRYEWVHSWAGRAVEALVNALNIAEVDATEVLDRLMKKHGVCMIEGSVFALDGETRTFTTHRVHTNRSGWTVTSDTKTIQMLPNAKKVIYHDNPHSYKVFYYRLHYRPIEGDFKTLEDALAWQPEEFQA